MNGALLVTESGEAPSDPFFQQRAQRIGNVLADERPRWFVTEHYPFGRHELSPEFRALLDGLQPLRRLGAVKVASSVRDILIGGPIEKARAVRVRSLIRKYYDLVLVHADPNFVTTDALTSPGVSVPRCVFTGFVLEDESATQTIDPVREWVTAQQGLGRMVVTVSVGGGREGLTLARVTLAALRFINPQCPISSLIITGPKSDPQEVDQLFRVFRGREHTLVVQSVPRLLPILRSSNVSVSHCGYNTATQLMASGSYAIVVPAMKYETAEQTARAMLLQRLGTATAIMVPALTPSTLAREIEKGLGSGHHGARVPVNLQGSRHSAGILCTGA